VIFRDFSDYDDHTMKLSDLGESGLISRIRSRFRETPAPLGIGDDAAIVDIPAGTSIVYCSDLLAENVHFIRDLHPADSIGYKSVAVNVSDVGAMGGVPSFFTLSIALPGDLELCWIDGFIDGIERACEEFHVNIAGGDSSSAELIFVDVSMIGWVETGNEIRRSGAKPGDGIYVTGSLGASALGLQYLRAGTFKHPSVARHLYPTPRHRIGRGVRSQAHAMIDLSDGLSTDLGHIVEESNVSAIVYRKQIPAAIGAHDEHMLHGGEDYELLIVAPQLPSEIDGVPITRIGEIVPAKTGSQILLVDGSREMVLEPHGYEHFTRADRPEP
jgi:thiamine-monophosphate kinase